MNIQEQAYIEGFVKRAAEYGVDENQAIEMLKEAARGAESLALAMRSLRPPTTTQGKKEFKNLANKLIKNKKNRKELVPARHSPDAKGLANDLRLIRRSGVLQHGVLSE
jgi:hypothetical protein